VRFYKSRTLDQSADNITALIYDKDSDQVILMEPGDELSYYEQDTESFIVFRQSKKTVSTHQLMKELK
jgi:hypothetical protein